MTSRVAAFVVCACAIAVADPGDPGMVKVEAAPSGEVTIDGKDLGPAPILEKLVAGDHEVSVARTGYRTFTQSIRIRAGQLITIRAELLHPAGTLKVTSDPQNAQVFLDGQLQESTTPATIEVDVGDHVLRVVKRGYQVFEYKLHVAQGETVARFANFSNP
jgi:hypothetical protein